MATKTLQENVSQAISDFNSIKQALINKGVEISSGTPTSEYGNKIIEIEGVDTSTVTDFSYFGQKDRFTEEQLQNINTSSGTDFSRMFYGCYRLTTIPQLDTSKGTSFGNMFFGCNSLTTIELTSFISSNNMFDGCVALKNLTVTGTITVNNNYLNFSSFPLLTVDSLMSVINALADNTGKTKYTITLGSTNLAKLTDEQKQIAIDKNYTLA